MHLGVAHTHGDAVAWLPKERILFAGDVCVNEKVYAELTGKKLVASLGARPQARLAHARAHGLG